MLFDFFLASCINSLLKSIPTPSIFNFFLRVLNSAPSPQPTSNTLDFFFTIETICFISEISKNLSLVHLRVFFFALKFQ